MRRRQRKRVRRVWRLDPAGATSTVTISNESGGLWSCGFSPYNADVNFQSIGFIYEPLLFINSLKSTAPPTPWLASSYHFSNGDRMLTFTIRKGVKWSDGQPLTPADVAFTFNLMKAHPALDLNALWSVLTSVKWSAPTTCSSPSRPRPCRTCSTSLTRPGSCRSTSGARSRTRSTTPTASRSVPVRS